MYRHYCRYILYYTGNEATRGGKGCLINLPLLLELTPSPSQWTSGSNVTEVEVLTYLVMYFY